MEYDYGVEDFGLPCPPWEDYAAAFDDHHSTIINLQPDTFFHGLDEDDDDDDNNDHDVGTIDGICSKEIKVQSKSSRRSIKHGRGKELRTAIRVLKTTVNQLAAAYRLLDKKKNKDTTKTSRILDDQPKKVMMNKKDTTSSILDDQPPKKVLVAAKVMKTTTATPIHKDRPNMMKMAMQKEAAIKKSSSGSSITSHVADKPKAVVLDRKNHNNKISIIGPKGDQDQKEEVVVVLPIRDEESSMQQKFESAKRKLHDSYERINAAKKQRRIQVIEFQKPPLPMPKSKARASYHAKYANKFHQPAAILQH